MIHNKLKELYNNISANFKEICKQCPYNHYDPENQCTVDNCLETHFKLGYKEGYEQALKDLKAPKTLAENRED